MNEQDSINVFDWHRMLYSENIPVTYLWEIGFKTFIMFLILVAGLKFLSKRGVKQLSVFELAILIALGSAIGDPMFYHDVPLTYGFVVLVVVIFMYKVITRLTGKNKNLEILLEGKPVCLLTDGRIEYKNYKRVGLPYDKFFAELRLKSVDHLGQVRKAYLETSGELSLYMFEDEEVIPGLPIYPELIANPLERIDKLAHHACIFCGHIQNINDSKNGCVVCGNNKWILPKSGRRIS